jgi:transcriptional regulator of acetoin/glycerol metabolism
MGQQPSMNNGSLSPFAPGQSSLVDFAKQGDNRLEQLPKLRELREDVFFRAEYLYLHNLVTLTGRNIRKACELSGLSRSRLYTLLRKYQISQPANAHNRQK